MSNIETSEQVYWFCGHFSHQITITGYRFECVFAELSRECDGPPAMVEQQSPCIPHSLLYGIELFKHSWLVFFYFSFILSLRLLLATSTEVEHIFSQGWQLLHFTHSRHAPSSIHAYMCLRSWSRHDLLLAGDLLSALRAKKRSQVETDNEN
jgi:hypothetical protein